MQNMLHVQHRKGLTQPAFPNYFIFSQETVHVFNKVLHTLQQTVATVQTYETWQERYLMEMW